MGRSKLKVWIEAMRLRTLPVSLSGVVMAIGMALWHGCFRAVPAVLCVVFALLAQVASNFANEYYDWRNGIDRKGREGFRRGVTEGDMSPAALKRATYGTLATACAVGCAMLPYGGWILLPAGIVIAAGALAYSAGPWPLSHHAMGELAVFVFYGLAPVNLTYYVMAGHFDAMNFMASLTVGFMGVNVLLVNNYRDIDDDRAAGKRTAVVVAGRPLAALAYLANGYVAVAMLTPLWLVAILSTKITLWIYAAPAIYLALHTAAAWQLKHRDGKRLNPLLGATARNMLIFTIITAACLAIAAQ